jgi:hypothetical protein
MQTGPPQTDTTRPRATGDRPAAERRPATATALVVVLFVQALGALAGGAALVAAPDGGVMNMPVSSLAGSPFPDYLVPGIVLFVVLGLGPLLTAVALLRRPAGGVLTALNPFPGQHWSWTLSGGAGVALLIWIAVEVTIIPFSILQPVYAAVGAVIVALTLASSVRRFYRR